MTGITDEHAEFAAVLKAKNAFCVLRGLGGVRWIS
jgi:hypothetical protein